MRKFLDIEKVGSRHIKKQHLLKLVIKCLLHDQEKTIPEICQLFNWSIPTGTKLVLELVKDKILIRGGKKLSGGGRRPDVFSLNPDMGYIIGIEILIQSLKLTIVNLQHETVYEFENIKFDIAQEDKALAYLKELIPSIIKQQKIPIEKIIGVGIGITGRVNTKEGISYTFLNFEKPLTTILQEAWDMPVYIDNDTHLMALGEKNFGHAKGKKDVVIVNVSRGIGASIIANDSILSGYSGFAGEFGHIHFTTNNKQCVCGKKGCLETIVSGKALEQEYNADTSTVRKQPFSYKEILQLSKKNDEKADILVRKMGEDLGQALSIFVQLLNPELIIIGGSFNVIGDKLIYPIAKGMNLYGLPQLVNDCDLKISILGERATILGAFSLVLENRL